MYATGVNCTCYFLLIRGDGTVTMKSRLILPFLSAICLLRAVTVTPDNCTVVMLSPVRLSRSACTTRCSSPFSSVHFICWGKA